MRRRAGRARLHRGLDLAAQGGRLRENLRRRDQNGEKQQKSRESERGEHDVLFAEKAAG